VGYFIQLENQTAFTSLKNYFFPPFIAFLLAYFMNFSISISSIQIGLVKIGSLMTPLAITFLLVTDAF
jgi:hypothetical protein